MIFHTYNQTSADYNDLRLPIYVGYAILPLKKGTEVSLFSRSQIDWFYVGYGSGGDVNCPCKVSLPDAIRNCDRLELNENLASIYENWVKNNPANHGIWGTWPYSQKEMPLDIITVQGAKGKSDTAVVSIGRAAGEDRDSAYENGCYLLSDDEIAMLDIVTDNFDKVIVLLNTGGIMDMSWVKKYGDKINAVMYVWQGGMESGNAIADLLCGKVSPSGRLVNTIAKSYFDYSSSDNFGGRNFEYYSEDPYISGKMAAAAVRGIQSTGLSACPKHFACNNQEERRNKNDSRLSERALREIYLKGFEICIKEAKPKNIMTSYNRINGVYGHYHYDLCTTILRGEWGYKGNVMTDWWMISEKSPENPAVKDQAYRVRAQIDLFMPGGSRTTNGKPDGTLLSSLGKPFGITLGEIQRSAMNVLNSVIDIKFN